MPWSISVSYTHLEIEFEAPDAPEIDPDGGTFGAQTDITITVPENCKVYYTWDSSDPSAASTEYTACLLYTSVTYYFIDNQEFFTGFSPYTSDTKFEIEKYTFFDKAVLLSLIHI